LLGLFVYLYDKHINMELTELEKKHAFSSDFFVNLMLLPNKYSTLNEEYKRAKECYISADSEEEKQIISLKLQWLHDALLVIEKAEKQNYTNRRYEPLEIPNVVPTPTESNITENAEVQWHMDRMDAIREKQKSKNRKPKPIKKKGEFNHPSSRTINCIGVEAAYDTPEGREYMKKRNEDFEEFKRNNC
jgi:hypothetical protein